MRRAGHVESMEDTEVIYSVLVGHLSGRDHLESLGLGWKIILKWSLKT
jgi:hypothetical protein